MRKLAAALCLFLSVYADAGKSRKDIPPAPLPSVVVNAKRVFLTNGGGSDLAYDTFYSEMKNWGKYQIVGSPDDADLIVEISYHVEHGGTRVWSTNNTRIAIVAVLAVAGFPVVTTKNRECHSPPVRGN